MSLKRKLGFWDIFCIAAGAMISSGLFILPGQAFAVAGPGVLLAYALAAVMMIPALLSKCELATAMPKSGGNYLFIERSLGTFFGTFAGFSDWLSLSLKSAFAMVGIGAFAQLVFPSTDMSQGQWEWVIKGIAVVCCVIFGILNCLSVKMVGRTQIIMVAGLLTVLVAFVVVGAPNVKQHPNFDNIFQNGFPAIFATAGLVFVSFGGLTKIASVAGEVRQPGRNIPAAMIMAFFVVSLLYVAVVFVLVGTLGENLIGKGTGDLTPLSNAAKLFMGPVGLVVLSVAAMLAFITTGNGGILAASRSPMAMSTDGMFPKSFHRVSKRFGTPVRSVIMTTSFIIFMIVVLSISDLVKVASTMMLILFLLVNVSLLIMRGSNIQNYRPQFRCPLFPWLQIVGITVYMMLIFQLINMLGKVPLLTALGFLAACLLWYVFYSRPRSSRQSALLYLVKNIVSDDISRAGLEDELRLIATERDEIVHDRFDFIVRDCEIMDMTGPVSANQMFERAADVFSGRLNIPSDVLLQKFLESEGRSSTVIQPGMAIPHIVLQGKHLFDLMLIRCKDGIVFDVDQPYVKTVFILVGSSDERNYHLRALMAIANIVQEDNFTERWTDAPTTESLRDIVLLSQRKRD
ncbi:MAG: amino acid permease [Phycisphaerae bacterium]|nr:amino acid permease [Phycisphaerae bacterium]